MTFYYIIAECYDDFRDYLDVYEIPESDSKHISIDSDLNIAPHRPFKPFNPLRQHHIHITKFAREDNDMVIKFIDLQIALSQKSSNVKTFIETDEGVVASANISFLKL
jgi:hypothetical protein